MEVIGKLDLIIFSKITEDLTRKWTINELAGEIGHHYRPVYAAVQKLLLKRLLNKNSNELIEPTFSNTFLLELGEKQRVQDIKQKEIIIILKRFIKNLDSSFYTVILFGSSVKSKGKDIDLLFILPDSEDISRFKQKATEALGSFVKLTDLNTINEESVYEMLNKPNVLNVMNEIMKNHLVLNGAENFYRIIRRWKNDF